MKLDEVRLGDIKFCPSSRAITLADGESVQLRNKSKEVLRYLVRHSDRVVTKKELMETVWADVCVSDESLVQCISDIRRIIGTDAKQIVETIPREGYRIHLPVKEISESRLVVKIALVAALAGVGVFLGSMPFKNSKAPPAIETTVEVQSQPNPPGTDNRLAYLEVLQGRVSANRFSREESLVAERHFRRAIEIDANYARAYAELATLLAVRFENNWTVLENEDEEKAMFYAEQSIAIDPESALAHFALGRLHSLYGKFAVAEKHLKRAMSLKPDYEDARAYYAVVRIFKGDAKGAVAILEPTISSHPNPPYWYYFALGHALFNSGDNEAAESVLNKCLELAHSSPYCLRYQIAVYGELGRTLDAKKAVDQYAMQGFDATVSAIMSLVKDRNLDDRNRLERALRAAGLPH